MHTKKEYDSNGRQYSYKLCSTCEKSIASNYQYYKRGYVDYNCLAYALGDNTK